MFTDNKIWIASNENRLYLLPQMANRHGIISGATGTGKTITLKVLAESFSEAGVPVFVSDVKGDLSGMGAPGEDSENMQKRIERFGLADEGFTYRPFPTRYWDVYGEKGVPVRATVMEMGPLLISRILGLNETQEGVMSIAFRVADDEGLLLLDFKDLRSMIQYIGENAKDLRLRYGNISPASIGAIQRALLKLEDQGAELFLRHAAFQTIFPDQIPE
jgi:DNA helicase HerA-like ATPase